MIVRVKTAGSMIKKLHSTGKTRAASGFASQFDAIEFGLSQTGKQRQQYAPELSAFHVSKQNGQPQNADPCKSSFSAEILGALTHCRDALFEHIHGDVGFFFRDH